MVTCKGYRYLIGICLTIHCAIGYKLNDTLYVSNGTSILRLEGITNAGEEEEEDATVKVDVIMHQAEDSRIVGLAMDIRRGLLFFSDVSANHKGIYQLNLKNKTARKIVDDIGIVNGLAVDWSSMLLFWTDEKRQSVEASDYEGQKRHLLVDEGLMWPRGVLADPVHGWLYWGDQGERRIERCRLDGSDRIVLADSNIDWPNQLALDYQNSELYWVDAYYQVMMALDLNEIDQNNPSHRPHRNFSRTVELSTIYGMALSGDGGRAYFTTWDDGGVHVTTLTRTGLMGFETVKAGLGEMDMFSIVLDDETTQPTDSPCAQQNGACSHLCFTTGNNIRTCACPTYSNLVLKSDKKTCTAVERFLLYSDKTEGLVGFITLPESLHQQSPHNIPATNDSVIHSGSTPMLMSNAYHKHILARSPGPVAVAYDPVEETVYWSDVIDGAIYRRPLTNGKTTTFMNMTDGIGTVDGLAIDWKQRRLYFTNRGNSRPKADGAVYSWQRVEMIGLDKANRITLTSVVDKPRAIVLDLDDNHIYFTDWGRRPSIARANMDGSNIHLFDHTMLSNPNGLALHRGKLYVADSNYDKKTSKKHVSVMDAPSNVSNSWIELDELYYHLHTPFSVAVTDDNVYVSDWRDSHIDGVILVQDRISKEVRQLPVQMKTPTGLLYVPLRKQQQIKDDSCHCEKGVCFLQPEEGINCVCPDSSTRNSCELPRVFAVFCDLNSIKLVNLEEQMEDIRTIYYGAADANFVAMAMDTETHTIYFSDLTRRSIYRMYLLDGEANLFQHVDDPLDGLTFDPDTAHVMWTAYNDLTYEGYIASKNAASTPPDGYDVIFRDLHRPRAIHVLDGHVYWTQLADPLLQSTGHVFKASLESRIIEVLNETRLQQPNALAIGNGHLYVGDGHYDKIDIYPFDDCQRRQSSTVMGSGIDHVFGLALFAASIDDDDDDDDGSVHDLALFTSWHSNTLRVLNVTSHNISTVQHRLYRPTAIVVNKSPQAGGNYSCPRKSLFKPATPPLFYNCPHDELLTLTLPANSNSTALPFTIFATDYNNHNLSLQFNRIPFGASTSPTSFRVTRHPPATSQSIIFSATDNIGKSSECRFSIRLRDSQAPRFINCPSSMTIFTASLLAVVEWPEPVAVDNVGVAAISGPLKSRDNLFAAGKYTIAYTAMDWDGNNATCQFHLNVIAKASLCALPKTFVQPDNGSVHCAGTRIKYQCVTRCESTHALNTDMRYHHVTCGLDGDWLEWFPADHHRLACRRKSSIRVIHETFKFWLPESECDELDPSTRQGLVDRIVENMMRSNICQFQHIELLDACSKESMSVTCDDTYILQERKRRSIEQKQEEFNIAIQLTLSFAIQESSMNEVDGVILELQNKLQQFFTTLDLVVGDVVIPSHNGHIEALQYQTDCARGSVLMEDKCVLCPAGYYHADEACLLCEENSYQSEEGSIACTVCPHQLLSLPGAYNLTMCMPGSELSPSSSSLLTVSILSIVLLSMLTLAVATWRVYKVRERKKYRVGDHQPDPAVLESLSRGEHIISNGKLLMDEQEEDAAMMTVTFSPSGSRLQQTTETNLDIE